MGGTGCPPLPHQPPAGPSSTLDGEDLVLQLVLDALQGVKVVHLEDVVLAGFGGDGAELFYGICIHEGAAHLWSGQDGCREGRRGSGREGRMGGRGFGEGGTDRHE